MLRGWGPSLRAHISLNHRPPGPISSYSRWDLGLQHRNLGANSSVCTQAEAEDMGSGWAPDGLVLRANTAQQSSALQHPEQALSGADRAAPRMAHAPQPVPGQTLCPSCGQRGGRPHIRTLVPWFHCSPAEA